MSDRVAKFWAKVNKSGSPEYPWCWIWTGYKSKGGYGKFWDGSRTVLAHRLAYEWLIEPVPAGLVSDHICRNRACVNPGHIEPVTNAVNIRRGRFDTPAIAKHIVALTAQRRAKTHCKHGHLIDKAWRNGKRYCSTCKRAINRKSYANNKDRNK